MKNIIIMIAIALGFNTALAQKAVTPLKISLKDRKDKLVSIITLEASLYIEGYDGDEIIIEPYNPLILINNGGKTAGLKNITAIANQPIAPKAEKIEADIREFPQQLQVFLRVSNYPAVLIKIPRALHLKLDYRTKLPDSKVSVKNLSGELELSGSTPSMELNNISGPVTLASRSATRSKIKISDIKWDAARTDKTRFLLYLSSNTDDFDITIPADLKTTFNISSARGDIYSDFDLVRKYPESNMLNVLKGDLNGGGVLISIVAQYGNIFIRKQK